MENPNTPGSILLVEDDNYDVGFFIDAMALAESVFSLVTVRDGDEAIRYLSGGGQYADRTKFPWPAVVVLDLNILRLDGFAVLRWMQPLEPSEKPPAVVLSSSTKKEDAGLAIELGAKEYMVKPSDVNVFVAWLKSLEAKVQTWSRK